MKGIVGTGHADALTGTASSERIRGLRGDDTLFGGGGLDTLLGGKGDDSLAGGADADLLDGGSGLDTLAGGGSGDTLHGGAGADLLDGGSGSDTMAGGADDDTYIVDEATDQIDETSGAGVDTVLSAVTFALSDHVENLSLTGAAGINGTGNALDNLLLGNTGDNVLDGGDGADTLNGAEGADRLFGGAGIDSISGGARNDTLEGGAETDFLGGDAGDDIFLVDHVAPFTDELIDFIDGGAGEGDTIRFTSTIAGTLLNLTPDHVGDVEVVRISDATGDSSGTTPLHVTVYYLETDITVIGNDGPNQLQGSLSLNGGGNDTIYGLGGDDLLIDQWGDDLVVGGRGNDWLETGAGVDTLRGGSGDDVISVINTISYTVGDVFDGGGRTDTVSLGNILHWDLTAVPDTDIIDIEVINIGERMLSLAYEDVVAISLDSDTLRIESSIAHGTVNVVDAGWVQGADQLIDGALHYTFTKQSATLLIDADAFFNI